MDLLLKNDPTEIYVIYPKMNNEKNAKYLHPKSFTLKNPQGDWNPGWATSIRFYKLDDNDNTYKG